MSRTRAFAVLCAASLLPLSLAGCSQRGILEVELDLPPLQDGGARFALTQARPAAGNPLEEDWAGHDVPAVELGDERRTDNISIVSEDTDVDVNIKVRFCRSMGCTDLEDAEAPQRWFSLEHPLYPGKRTFFSARIGTIPSGEPERVDVGKCKIRGCVEGELSNYCRLSGGDRRHFCR